MRGIGGDIGKFKLPVNSVRSPPPLPPMPPESPGHQPWVLGRQPVQNGKNTHRRYIVYLQSENNVTRVYLDPTAR